MKQSRKAATATAAAIFLGLSAAAIGPVAATTSNPEPVSAESITTRSAPTSINDCTFNMKWQKKTLRGKCGSKKFKVKGNGFSYTRLKGKVYKKKFNVRFSDMGAGIDAISGRVGGKKIRNLADDGLGPSRRSSFSGRTKTITADFGVGKGKRAQQITCQASGIPTGPAEMSWTSTSFTSHRWAAGTSPKTLKGNSPMWGACAVLVGSAAVYLST